MKRIISVLLLATLLFTTAACLTSCDKDDGAQISVYLNERIYNLDPAGSYLDDATVSILHMIYEPLFTLDEDGDVKKAMADKYEFEKETGDLVIDLRESYWSSGKRVTAADFVWAWKRILDSNHSFECAPLLYDIKNARYIKTATIPEGGSTESINVNNFGAVAEDEDTLRITFENPDVDHDAFLRNLTNISLAPVNRESLNGGQESYWFLTDNMTGYCNGPFRVREFNTEEGYFTLARNTEYHRPKDSNKDADHFVVPAMLRTVWDVERSVTDPNKKTEGYLDAMYDRMAEQAENTVFYMSSLSLADRKDPQVQKDAEVSNAMSTYTYIFDTDNPLFADPLVRRTLSQVIDRNKVAELVTFGVPATGFISHGVWDAKSARESKSFRSEGGELISTSALDIGEAQKLLASAPKGAFEICCENRDEDRAIADYVAGLWTALGYTVTVKPCTAYGIDVYPDVDPGKVAEDKDKVTFYTSELITRYENRDFDVIAVDYQMFSTNALTALASLSGNFHGGKTDLHSYNNQPAGERKPLNEFRSENIAGYSNPAYDEKIAQALNTYDLKARAAILHEAETILMQDMPVVPLLFNQTYYVKHKYLKNLDVNYYGFTVFTRAKLKNYDEYFLDN